MIVGAGAMACTNKPSTESDVPTDLVVILVPGLRAEGSNSGAESQFWKKIGRTPDVRYTSAYAQTPSPRVSIGSMLTGMYPSAIPLCGRYVPREYDLQDRGQNEQAWCATIPPDRHTWPKVLSLYDYRTVLIRGPAPGAEHIDPAFNEVIEINSPQRNWVSDWPRMREKARSWWQANSDSPRLLVVLATDLELPALSRFFDESGMAPEYPGDKGAIAHPDVLRKRYTEEAAKAGTAIGGILEDLQVSDRPVWSVVTSTHGVSLGERSPPSAQERAQAYDHLKLPTTQILMDRTTHVPLALFGPTQRNKVVEDPVELIDVFPTLAGLSKATEPAQLQGDNLLSATDENPVAYSEFGDMLALRKDNLLLTFRCFLHNGTSLDPELTSRFEKAPLQGEFFSLHDVVKDSMQQENLQKSQPEQVETLRNALLNQRKGPGAPPPDALGAEELKALRLTPALGYW
ncbi:MAG: hypothetical protein VX519_06320 [Myxococcota bacterium]|nr:hypothetical protein [Myxococcota bacterium]